MSTQASIHGIIRDTEEILREQFDCPTTIRFFMDRMAQGIFESLGWDDGSDTEFLCDDCDGSGIHRETVTRSGVEIILRVLCHCVGCNSHQPAEIEMIKPIPTRYYMEIE